MGDIDISLRALAAAHPEDVARGLFVGSRVEFVGWRATNLALMERRTDDLQELRVDGEPMLGHHEFELAWSSDLDERVFEYHSGIALAQVQRIASQRKALREARAAGESVLPPVDPFVPVASTVVLMSGPKEGPGGPREFRTSPSTTAFSGVRYRVLSVYLMDIDALLELPGPLWTVFAPIARDASPEGVSRAVVAARARSTGPQEYADVLATMSIVAESRGATEAIQEMLMKAMEDEGVVLTSRLYRRGRDEGRVEGRVEGLGPLVHQFERRLRRTLSDAERMSLATHLDSLGAVTLGDLVLDLDDAALAAWVAKLTA